jgi:hypothetical protein
MIRRNDGCFHSFIGNHHIKLRLTKTNWCTVFLDNEKYGEGPFNLVKSRLNKIEQIYAQRPHFIKKAFYEEFLIKS